MSSITGRYLFGSYLFIRFQNDGSTPFISIVYRISRAVDMGVQPDKAECYVTWHGPGTGLVLMT